MKQSESDKFLNELLRGYSARFGWKCSRGFVFKKAGELFFTILITGIPKTKRLSWSINFKHYEFDDIFWDGDYSPTAVRRVWDVFFKTVGGMDAAVEFTRTYLQRVLKRHPIPG